MLGHGGFPHHFDVTPEERLCELERSHDELRGALLAAGRQLKKYPNHPRTRILLAELRQVLGKARVVRYGPTGKPALKQIAASCIATASVE